MGLTATTLLFVSIFISWWIVGGSVALPPNVTVPALLVLGDSIVDTGNNNNLKLTLVKCNFSPYGQDLNGGVATGRFTNSKTPGDLLGSYICYNKKFVSKCV